jgi:nicotinate-nucleotide adenylyltransferase
MMTLCLYGGAFDPVHKGHIHFAKRIVQEFNADVFYFVPTFYSPFKGQTKHASDEHRLNMLQLALKHIPHAHMSTMEIDRGGLSYTLETLKAFNELYPGHKIYWVIGDDHLSKLDQWKGYPDHFTLCDFIVLPRTGLDPESFLKDMPYRSQIHFLDDKVINVSSTRIRHALKNGQSILSYVPEEINDYIVANKLYR